MLQSARGARARAAAPLAPPITSVRAARQLLQDTSRQSPEPIDAAARLVSDHLAQRPHNVRCGCMQWTEHVDAGGEPAWACAACHAPPPTSAANDDDAAPGVILGRATAAPAPNPGPKPRDVLQKARAELRKAAAER